MSDTSRPWYQVNILTAVVLLLIAGGFLWINLINLYPVPCGGQMGWPFAYLLDSPGGFQPVETFDWIAPTWLAPHIPIVLNVFSAVSLVVLVARVCAWIRTPGRRRPQIHLSTALVMMFVAASLMWLNAHVWNTYSYGTSDGLVVYNTYGWPTDCVSIVHHSGKVEWNWIRRGPSGNVFVCLMLMYATMTLCEWRIRRQEVRTP